MSAWPKISDGGRGRRIAVVAAAALAQAVAAAVAAIATRDVFVALSAETGSVPIEALAALTASGCVIAMMRVLERVTAERLGQHFAGDLRLTLFEHLSQMPGDRLAQRRSGGLALRFVGDLTAIREWVSRGLTRLISVSLVLPTTICVLFWLDPRIGVAGAVPMMLGLLAMALIGARMEPAHRRVRSCRGRLAADMSERAPIAPHLALIGRMGQERARLARRTEQLSDAAAARARFSGALRAIPDLVTGTSATAILAVALLGGISPPVVAGALAGAALMVAPMRDLAGIWDRYRAWQIARAKAERLLEQPKLSPAQATARPESRRPNLRFQSVRTGAGEELSLTLSAGHKMALFGGTGSGKSQLLAYAAGLSAPKSGEVSFGDIPVLELDPVYRARKIAFMSANRPILAGSLRRALSFGVGKRPSDPEILEIVETLGLELLFARLGGLDGQVAEGGRNLSRGEAGLVRFAPLLMSRPKLILLDCPDRELDPYALEGVFAYLAKSRAAVLLATDTREVAARLPHVIELGIEPPQYPTQATM